MKSKKSKSAKSIYQVLGKKIEEKIARISLEQELNLGATIRRLRQEKNLSGVELCRRAADLDPKTLTAVEKGRIRNPSIKTMLSISRGLTVTVADLFRQAEVGMDRNLYLGSQKGAFQIEFPWWGVKMVSFTPFIKDFFCGKLILAPKRRVDETLLKHPLPFFISTLIGRFEVTVEGKTLDLKEGDNLFFNGILKHSFHNPLHRESVLLMVTSPSFF
jgi:transcriptional regulator with XRE-family HTH domain